jgi:hypothetical protein
MDPYLESDLWTTFHTQYAVAIAGQISPSLKPRYAAFTEKRFITDSPDEVEVGITVIPDVGVTETRFAGVKSSSATVAAPLEVTTLIAERIPHVWIEIRDVENRQLVTVIEFLSPANKHGDGRDEYLSKRNVYLHSNVNLIEIDLITQGQRIPTKEVLPDAPYFAFLTRVRRRPKTETWPMAWDRSLSEIPVPLLPGDDDVVLNLQHAFTYVYDLFNYEYLIDYSRPPKIPLSSETEQWMDHLLRSRGKR